MRINCPVQSCFWYRIADTRDTLLNLEREHWETQHQSEQEVELQAAE